MTTTSKKGIEIADLVRARPSVAGALLGPARAPRIGDDANKIRLAGAAQQMTKK